ncbi:hypothetical protein FOXG_13584 [Fusarium oxysporum f. sp. lycopersici 4287]|uniref:Uncharacterized protein n=3 Tax=Fusarium oxysporum TaxID=5507 RepID=A0A0J9VW51_FUSO4|nr:hypothetical protein FOXG_13584 [Fusarium oxysporum f. sp. lycopersici 4287]EXK34577.1 hypothetical protein FOMG_09965 [Fusarium oxysporum f. sp. melonis 26406]KNB14815.1 hypothetical protein FOXG_13584 [Fusarium oxysporum f. sp. lycopersici 4287]
MMFSASRTSHSTEVTSLIKKHGVTDALFIMNLGYFTNIHLTEVGGQGFAALSPGVRNVDSGLKNPIGLTSSGYRILAFWSNHLGTAKVLFLAEYAYTIHDARGGKGPYSKHDLEFIRWTVGAMKHEIATTDKLLDEGCTDHGDILDLEYEMRTEAGMKCLLTGSVKPKREYTTAEENMTTSANEHDSLAIADQDIDKITDPKQSSTLAGVEMAISRIEGYGERLEAEKLALTMTSRYCVRSGSSLNRGSIH